MVGHVRLVSLTSDFGEGHYVGEMRGVIKKVNIDAEIVDVTHSIERYNVFGGAFVLSRIWRHFPKNTVHVVVVDPGVGSKRKAIAIETDYCFLLGPDNGVLRWALKDQEIVRVIDLDPLTVQERAGLTNVSATFHGRDVFAPAAGLLTRGVDIDTLGTRIKELQPLDLKEDTVIHVDSFGNIITTIAKDLSPGMKLQVIHGPRKFDAVGAVKFSDVNPGELVVLKGSHGLLEVDVNHGNAAERLGVRAGDSIQVEYVG
ncbi:MAG: SAM-dependent chlorinase/fluorinase [Candidatus Altiarchaeota archaeon]